MKKLTLCFLLVVSGMYGIAMPPSAIAANCISLGFPSVTSSSGSIKVDIPVTSSCRSPFGLSGGGPVYSIIDESLFSSSCSGPYDYSLFGSGTISCTITLGGSLGSSRVGATSSTVKVWFAYDSSTLQKSFNHAAIPSKNTSSGGSSGSTAPAPVVQSCLAAPGVPSLTIEWNSIGPKFTFAPKSSGEKATALFWNYNLYNSTTNEWEGWSKWTNAPAETGNYQASVIAGKSKIAFAVQAANACGASDQAREADDLKGVALAARSQDIITSSQSPEAKLRVGQQGSISSFASSKFKLKLTAQSISPNICEIDLTSMIKLIAPGNCTLVYSSIADGLNSAAPATNISFKVYPAKIDQTIPDLNLKNSYTLSETNFILNAESSAGLPVSFESATETYCSIIGDRVVFHGIGNCMIFASQVGDEDTKMAFSRDYTFWIVDNPKKTTITCIKGKVTKKVTGISPKCLAGYKKK